jgi:hypothetical protein
MGAEDACSFDRLPFAMRDSFLQQAFKLLDQHHRYGVVPLVCRLWSQLVTSTCSCLDVKVTDNPAAKGLASWLERHNPPLESIHLDIEDAELMPKLKKLLKVVCTKTSLQSLRIDLYEPVFPKIPLSSLTNLTSLELHSCSLGRTTLESVLLLTQLRHLKLDDPRLKEIAFIAFVRGIARSLLHLTTLDLCANFMPLRPNQLLPLTSLRCLKTLQLNTTTVEAEGIAVLNQVPIISLGISIRVDEVGDVCSWLQGGGDKIETLHLFGVGFHTICLQPLALPDVELLMSHLRTCAPQLRSLSLCCLTQAGHCTGLAGLTQLTRLGVYSEFDDAALLRLSALTGLRELDARYNQVRWGESFLCLASSLQQLTRVDFQSSSEAHEAAKLASGSRVAEVFGRRLMLRPVPAGD